jgi:pyridoxine 5-phosphate synthase
MSVALSINLNKIALIRNSRPGNNPDLIAYAKQCIELGCQGITVHPRPDQRHIRASDIAPLAELCRLNNQIEFNIEGNPLEGALEDYPGFIPLVESARPDQCTLVPDASGQPTSDHGFDLQKTGSLLEPIIQNLKNQGIRVSLFMDPDLEQIRLAKQVGADRIELYTGPYAEAFSKGQHQEVLAQHVAAGALANEIGLGVNAGHDLNLDNLAEYRSVPYLTEVSIGHAFTLDSLQMGIKPSMAAYLNTLS